jgi:TolB-like protein/DNA-binding winged helix-turn-helix (wHTH) protein/tetratricopeptide (TPR) repeat protein
MSPIQPLASSTLYFDSFALDPTRGCLMVGDQELSLRPKSFDVLQFLARNPERMVTKDELIKAIWPNVAVTDDSLVQCIHEIRLALRDDGQHIIRTVPRRGYRFIAQQIGRPPDGPVGSRPDPAATSRFSLPAFRPTARFTSWIVLFSLSMMMLFGWTYYRSSRQAIEPGIRTLAVLPFDMIGTEGRYEYLGLGMADTLILRLSAVRELAVRPTSAVISYVNQKTSSLHFGKELGVDAVLEGRIYFSGDRIRVNAQLIRLLDGETLWADRFEDNYTDVFRVQDAIARKVADSIVAQLSRSEAIMLSRSHTVLPEAYRAYLKGRFFWAKRTEAGLVASIDDFRRALTFDPNYALAYAGMADSFNLVGAYGAYVPRDAFLSAKEAALKAIELDPLLAEAHAALGFAKAHADHDWPGAESSYRRAIELNPNYATAHQWYGLAHIARGSVAAAIGEAQQALNSDPLSLIINTDLGRHFYYAGRYDEAADQLRKTINLDPSFVRAHQELGRVYKQQGLLELAIIELQRAVELSNRSSSALADLAHAYAMLGNAKELQTLVAELSARAQASFVSAYHFAIIHAGARDDDATLDALERAYEERFNWIVFLNVEPCFAHLRNNPRFIELVRRLGVSQDAATAHN